jgi:hypothetical protein
VLFEGTPNYGKANEARAAAPHARARKHTPVWRRAARTRR